ncbi:hypothetical protein [Actinomyces lilanjuaniae]|nr:hypothetical protein [Actinomyces lilanjuaniae]
MGEGAAVDRWWWVSVGVGGEGLDLGDGDVVSGGAGRVTAVFPAGVLPE